MTNQEIRARLPKDFCPLPFTQLFMYPTGQVFPCCESGYLLGHASNLTIEEIWNGERMQDLRKEFLSGNIKICANAIKSKGCHLANENLLQVTKPVVHQEEPVKSFDLMLNGKCNLECIMCPVWTLPNQVYDQSTFWTEGRETIFSKLARISVKSGEPFIQKDTYRLINEVSAVNRNCLWMFTTNGQFKLNSFILDHLDKIEIDCVKVSVDSLNETTYSKIRKLGDLQKVVSTLERLVAYREKRTREGRGFLLGVNMAVQKSNWREIPEMIGFCRKMGVQPIFLYVFKPGRESLTTVTVDDRIEILEYYYDFLSKYPSHFAALNTILIPLLNEMPPEIRPRFERRKAEIFLNLFSNRQAAQGDRACELATGSSERAFARPER